MTTAEQFKQALNQTVKSSCLLSGSDPLYRIEKEFMYELIGRSDETKKTYHKYFNRLYDFIGNTVKADNPRETGMNAPVECLDVEGIGIHYYAYVSGFKLAEQTVISCMRHFRVIYYWCAEHKLVSQQKIEVHTVEPPLKATFTMEEITRLTCRKPSHADFINYRDWVMINYLLATGNRISSILALRVCDVDFETDEIRVQVTKSKRPQIMSLQPKLKLILLEYIRTYRVIDDVPLSDASVFCNMFGGTFTYDGAVKSFRKYFINRGVSWHGFHKFRHSYAANWIRCGGDSLTLKAQLGHSSLAMTNRYANLYGKAVAGEVGKYSLISAVRISAGRKKLTPNKQ